MPPPPPPPLLRPVSLWPCVVQCGEVAHSFLVFSRAVFLYSSFITDNPTCPCCITCMYVCMYAHAYVCFLFVLYDTSDTCDGHCYVVMPSVSAPITHMIRVHTLTRYVLVYILLVPTHLWSGVHDFMCTYLFHVLFLCGCILF